MVRVKAGTARYNTKKTSPKNRADLPLTDMARPDELQGGRMPAWFISCFSLR